MIGNWLRLDGEGHGTFTAPWSPSEAGHYKIWVVDDQGHEIPTQAYLTPEMTVVSPGGWFDDGSGMRWYTRAEFAMNSGGRVLTEIDPTRTVNVEWRSN